MAKGAGSRGDTTCCRGCLDSALLRDEHAALGLPLQHGGRGSTAECLLAA